MREKDKECSIEHIKDIFRKEFQRELENRERQLELIQKRITEASKTLQLLRYCLVTSYYKGSELQASKNDNGLSNFDDQSRIHPTIKNLLITNNTNLPKTNLRAKKTHSSAPKVTEPTSSKISKNNPSSDEKFCTRKEAVVEHDNTDLEANNSNIHDRIDSVDIIRNKVVTKHRIIIGNVSKWYTSDSTEDCSTHKWMVYVRGPKDSPDLSHIVQKVVFYLHPSYKPNDVIEVSKGPFHLSRRGWGEFPLRIQLFFHKKWNKPVDIIYNLKLDMTFSGRQILGNEIVLDVSLFDRVDTLRDCENLALMEHSSNSNSKDSELCILGDDNTNEKDIDIFNEVPVLDIINRDHSYCIGNGGATKLHENETGDNTKHSLSNETESNNVVSLYENTDEMVRLNCKSVSIKKRKKPGDMLLQHTDKKVKIDGYEQYLSVHDMSKVNRHRVQLPHEFSGISQMLPYLFKRLPLISELASDPNYKYLYPYTCRTFNEFSSWKIEKRMAAEWSRARTIKKILNSYTINEISEKWYTKTILLYGRAYGYTPLCNYNIFNKKRVSFPKDLVGFQNPVVVPTNYVDFTDTVNHVDVVKCIEEENGKNDLEILHDYKFSQESSFVKQAALDVGIILKPEEIIPGVLYNSAEKVLLESIYCLAESLIRGARAALVQQEDFCESTSIITTKEVYQVLKQRSNFNKILSFNKDNVIY